MSSVPLHDPARLDSLARQTGFSRPAVESMLASIVRGGGRMAQFDDPEFGGAGQWMHGGMLMIADFSNVALKRRVDALCEALAEWVAHDPEAARRSATAGGPSSDHWYPASLGTPDSSGAQNAVRYAWFGASRRLAIDRGGRVTIHDTGDHRIGGVAQQQGEHGTLTFTSQHGPVDVDRLPVVHDAVASPVPSAADAVRESLPSTPANDPFAALERLADLHARGIVDAAEFSAKKAELLKRI